MVREIKSIAVSIMTELCCQLETPMPVNNGDPGTQLFDFCESADQTAERRPKKELLSRPRLEIVRSEDRDRTVRAATGVASGNDTLALENRILCKDGSIKRRDAERLNRAAHALTNPESLRACQQREPRHMPFSEPRLSVSELGSSIHHRPDLVSARDGHAGLYQRDTHANFSIMRQCGMIRPMSASESVILRQS